MILIVEAGGTKSNLALVNPNGIEALYVEPGLHLSRESTDELVRKVQRWADLCKQPPEMVWVFAAGANSSEKTTQAQVIISEILQCSQVKIESDLMAACYSTAGIEPGIVGILGTGSNSCFYNGKTIIHAVPPGGFILGDEGSGAHIGRIFLRDFIRNQVPGSIKESVSEKLGLSSATIIQQVYGGSIKDSVHFCALSGGFVLENQTNEYCHRIAKECIHEYFNIIESNFMNYSRNLHLVGSVAYILKSIIQTEADHRNINLIKIIQRPINELSLFLAPNKDS